MKKYLVIGNPNILYNYWIKQNNLNAFYEKSCLTKQILKIINELKNDKFQELM